MSTPSHPQMAAGSSVFTMNLTWMEAALFRALFYKQTSLSSLASLISCVTLGKLFNFSEPELPACEVVVPIALSSRCC